MSKTPAQYSRDEALAKSEEILAQELLSQVRAFAQDLRKDGEDPDAPPDEPPAGEDPEPPADVPVDPPADAGMDPDALAAAYAQMSPEELQQHADAIAQAQAQAQAGSDGQGPPAAAGGELPPVEQAEKAERDPRARAARDLRIASENLAKSRAPAERAPTRRAATAPRQPGPTQLSKGEVRSRLLEKSRDPATTSRDRSLINSYVTGAAKVDAVAHLLK